VRRVTHEGMCLMGCKTFGWGTNTTVLPGVPRNASAWGRQTPAKSARMNAVKLFDGVGDGVKARLWGRVAKMV